MLPNSPSRCHWFLQTPKRMPTLASSSSSSPGRPDVITVRLNPAEDNTAAEIVGLFANNWGGISAISSLDLSARTGQGKLPVVPLNLIHRHFLPPLLLHRSPRARLLHWTGRQRIGPPGGAASPAGGRPTTRSGSTGLCGRWNSLRIQQLPGCSAGRSRDGIRHNGCGVGMLMWRRRLGWCNREGDCRSECRTVQIELVETRKKSCIGPVDGGFIGDS